MTVLIHYIELIKMIFYVRENTFFNVSNYFFT